MSKDIQYPYSQLNSSKRSELFQSKEAATTKNETVERSEQELEWYAQDDPTPKSQNVKRLEDKIHRVKVAQEELEEKFEKVVQHLTLEINKKDEINEELQKQIDFLQKFLKESKQDLEIIKNYLKKQESRQSCKENSRKTVNLNETVYKINKSTARNPIFTDITVQSIVTSRKSISPRMKLLKKQIKG